MNTSVWKLFRRAASRQNKKVRKLENLGGPHNPNSRTRHFTEEQRSRLFYDRPFIYGRLPKWILIYCASMMFWSSYYSCLKKEFAQHSAGITKQCLRKTVPFVQAMEDIRFIAVQERNYMILKAICDSENPELFDLYRTRYNQEDFFETFVQGSSGRNGYDGSYGTSRWWDVNTNRKPEDEKYLVGFQEQSMAG